jgi:RNA polymerase sigma-70 factor (ECF subfamily)
MNRRPSGEPSDDWAGRLYDRFAAGLYRHALMILANREEAADAVQQVFAAILRRGRRDFDCDEAYLQRAVRNESYTILRKRQRDMTRAGEASLLEGVAAGEERPDERLATEQAIRALPPEQREVIHLKVFSGMTFQEIATMTGDSINTVASRYRYAIEKLRSRL